MAHWLLRERMAEHNEDGRPRQEHPRRGHHRSEQNQEHGEAARGLGVPPTDAGFSPDRPREREDEFDGR